MSHCLTSHTHGASRAGGRPSRVDVHEKVCEVGASRRSLGCAWMSVVPGVELAARRWMCIGDGEESTSWHVLDGIEEADDDEGLRGGGGGGGRQRRGRRVDSLLYEPDITCQRCVDTLGLVRRRDLASQRGQPLARSATIPARSALITPARRTLEQAWRGVPSDGLLLPPAAI